MTIGVSTTGNTAIPLEERPAELLQEWTVPKSIVITVERAKDLRDMSSLGRMDPYAEVIYGVDCPLPPALGAARLVAWYNVTRAEAMAEMRLFDL